MSAIPTTEPYRQALTLALEKIVTAICVPALNASLAAQFSALPSGSGVVFSADDVRLGNLLLPGNPTLCISSGKVYISTRSNSDYWRRYDTDIFVKIPLTGNPAVLASPEGVAAVFNTAGDTMIDALSSLATYWINANDNLAGTTPCVSGTEFTDCYAYGIQPFPPERSKDGVTTVAVVSIQHKAEIITPINRADALTFPSS